jgi:hypothetical protein
MHVLPFMGSESVVKGTSADAQLQFRLPPLERGTIVWFSN